MRGLYPQGVVDHHHDPGPQVFLSEDPIEPYHGGLHQIGFDLLAAMSLGTQLHPQRNGKPYRILRDFPDLFRNSRGGRALHWRHEPDAVMKEEDHLEVSFYQKGSVWPPETIHGTSVVLLRAQAVEEEG